MDTEKLKAMVREEINTYLDRYTNIGQFSMSQIPFHQHNGLDSNKVHYHSLNGAPGFFYYGLIGSATTKGTPFPTGWSISSAGTGLYTVTHNLKTTNYAILATAANATDRVAYVSNRSANSFTVGVRTLADVAATSDVYFILLKQNV